jgi:AcrR family transcriptional regulator
MTQNIDWYPDTDWVFTPAQERSRNSLEKVLRAAKTLFLERGFEETTITEISKLSGVSVGSIYHRFADKQAILQTVLEGYRRTRYAQVLELVEPERWRERSLREVLEFHIEVIFSATARDAAIYRLIERQRMVSPRVNEQVAAWDHEICELLLGLYRTRACSLNASELTARVKLLHNLVRGAALWSNLGAGPRHHYLDVEDADHRARVTALALSYLELEP